MFIRQSLIESLRLYAIAQTSPVFSPTFLILRLPSPFLSLPFVPAKPFQWVKELVLFPSDLLPTFPIMRLLSCHGYMAFVAPPATTLAFSHPYPFPPSPPRPSVSIKDAAHFFLSDLTESLRNGTNRNALHYLLSCQAANPKGKRREDKILPTYAGIVSPLTDQSYDFLLLVRISA